MACGDLAADEITASVMMNFSVVPGVGCEFERGVEA